MDGLTGSIEAQEQVLAWLESFTRIRLYPFDPELLIIRRRVKCYFKAEVFVSSQSAREVL